MTAAPPESPVTEGLSSLEVRWIFPGQLEAAVAGWFGRFPAVTETRQDTYLMHPPLPELSVKIRGSRALEVKVYHGSPGILHVPGRARGRMESWQKWSFPCSPLSPGHPRHPGHPGLEAGPQETAHQLVLTGQRTGSWRAPPGWASSRSARWNSPRSTRTATSLVDPAAFRGDRPWAGPLRGTLEAAAALVFAHALPEGVEPGLDESRSYAQWLGQRPGPDSDAA